MKCPYCSNEMEEGIIQSNGSVLLWTNNKHLISLLANSSKGEIQLDHTFGSASINGNICRICQKIIIDYK
jgi:hypothetical protein